MKKISIIKAYTEKYYHVLPSQLEMITVSPEREAIFKYLSQIGADRFPEFVKDVLVIVEGHQPVDITDGTGDEKQDILTMTPAGERQLTQCKHTSRYEEHYSGDELDLLFGAAFRKNCSTVLFVTNSDLTPQGKRYVTDKEYARGARTSGAIPEIDYWNGERVWQRIAGNTSILNKWFSGMAQAHGLRSFSFDLAITRLPEGDFNDLEPKTLFEALGRIDQAEKVENDLYQIEMDEKISFTITTWFRSDLDLDVRYVSPKENKVVNAPVRTLKIQVSLKADVSSYSPEAIQDRIVGFIAEAILPQTDQDEWWYLIATSPQAFVFLHDIITPKVIPVGLSQTYVKACGSQITREREWIFPTGEEYKRLIGEDQDELCWAHFPSGTEIWLLLEQHPHPIAAYENYLRQLELIERLQDYELRVVPAASKKTVDLVRNCTGPKWVVMVAEDHTLFFAFPREEDEDTIRRVERSLRDRQITVLHIKEKHKNSVLERIDTSPNLGGIVTGSESEIVTPVMLNKRVYLLTRQIKVVPPKEKETWLRLFKFKRKYESQHGVKDLMKETNRFSIDEIAANLYDMLSVRGTRMLDITFSDEEMKIAFRVREPSADSTNMILPAFIKELDEIERGLSEVLEPFGAVQV